MLIHIAVTCCLASASLAASQGYGATRNSVVQGSALPRRFSVSKGKGYLPPSAYATARPQYQAGGTGYQSSAGSQYQGSSGSGSGGYQGGATSQYQGSAGSGSGGYQGGATSQYQGSAGSGSGGYQGGATSQYQGSAGSRYSGSGSSQYGSGGNQYSNAASQYTTEDPYTEPANYDFSYEVNAPEYAVMFGHQESRRDMLAMGSYRVLLPDGRTQVVEYEADQEGYRPTITYQESAGGAGGYQGGNQGGYQGGSGRYSQGGNQGGYQGGRGNGGYSQNGNGYKGSTGKASYGQKGYGGQNNGGAGKGQGYRY